MGLSGRSPLASNNFDLSATDSGNQSGGRHHIPVNVAMTGIEQKDGNSDASQKDNLTGDEVAFGLDEKVNYILYITEFAVSVDSLSRNQRFELS